MINDEGRDNRLIGSGSRALYICAGLPSRDNIVRGEGGWEAEALLTLTIMVEIIEVHRDGMVVSKEQAMWMETMRFKGFRFS